MHFVNPLEINILISCTLTVLFTCRDKTVPSWTHSGSIHVSKSVTTSDRPHSNKPNPTTTRPSVNKVYIPNTLKSDAADVTESSKVKKLPVIVASINSSPVQSVAMATHSGAGDNATTTTVETRMIKSVDCSLPQTLKNSSPKTAKKMSCPSSRSQSSMGMSPGRRKQNSSLQSSSENDQSKENGDSTFEESMDVSVGDTAGDTGDTAGDTGDPTGSVADPGNDPPVVIGGKRKRESRRLTGDLQVGPRRTKRRKVSR